MSSGTFSKTVVATFPVLTASGTFDCQEIEVEAIGTWEYDPGCRYTRDGDGWPSSLDFEASVENRDEVLADVRKQLAEAGETAIEDDAAILETVRAIVDEELSEEDVRDYAD
jgi:hypothetical protein